MQIDLDNLKKNKIYGRLFFILCHFATVAGILILIFILISIIMQGYDHLSWDFITHTSSRFPEKAGILPGIIGSIYALAIASITSIPLGIGAAIYLEEYAQRNSITNIIRLNIRNLAGVPSIVYGILGVALFVKFLNFGRSILSGGLTLAFLMLPIVTISSQEALRYVSKDIRRAGFSLGLTKWKIIYHLVLPAALPGFLTGIILSLSRVIGEASPLILVGAVAYITFLPISPFDQFTVLPIQIFNWASKAIKDFHFLSASASLVLILLLFTLNITAVYIRSKQRNKM